MVVHAAASQQQGLSRGLVVVQDLLSAAQPGREANATTWPEVVVVVVAAGGVVRVG